MPDLTLSELDAAVRPTAPAALPQEPAGMGQAESAAAAQRSEVQRLERRRLLARVAAVVVVVAFTAITIAVCRSLPNPHLKLELHNDSGADVTDVRFAFADGRAARECKGLATGGVVSWDIDGESQGFAVDYRDGGGRAVSRKCDVYVDADQWGTMFVHIKPGGLKAVTEIDSRR